MTWLVCNCKYLTDCLWSLRGLQAVQGPMGVEIVGTVTLVSRSIDTV
jgi:hypothetical protein